MKEMKKGELGTRTHLHSSWKLNYMCSLLDIHTHIFPGCFYRWLSHRCLDVAHIHLYLETQTSY